METIDIYARVGESSGVEVGNDADEGQSEE